MATPRPRRCSPYDRDASSYEGEIGLPLRVRHSQIPHHAHIAVANCVSLWIFSELLIGGLSWFDSLRTRSGVKDLPGSGFFGWWSQDLSGVKGGRRRETDRGGSQEGALQTTCHCPTGIGHPLPGLRRLPASSLGCGWGGSRGFVP